MGFKHAPLYITEDTSMFALCCKLLGVMNDQ